MKNFIKYSSILLVIIWMSFVFIFSAESGETSKNSSNSFTKFVFRNNITDEKVESLSFIVRKFAHFTLYVIGGMCICVCMIMIFKNTSNVYFISYIIGTLYAVTDELHQQVTPNRSCEIRDMIIDSIGVLCGVLIIKIVTFSIKKIRKLDKRSD